MRDFNLNRKKKELTPDTLYQILWELYDTDIARKKYKELTGMEYIPEYLEENDE